MEKSSNGLQQPARCINLDWLEVYAEEDIIQPVTVENLRTRGYWLEVREYGTRIYNEMYKVLDDHGYSILEVRRDPKNKSVNAILPINACHIRLSNRTCYSSNAVDILRSFCQANNITIVSVYRVDIALDFEKFDSGDDPQKFLLRYCSGRYSKVNQANIHAHGADKWHRREWNSLSWGSPHSPIGTKFYCKTQELREVKDKPYIRYAWFNNGIIDDPGITAEGIRRRNDDGTHYKPEIWRVEFSIRSSVKNWVCINLNGNSKEKYSLRNTLDQYDTQAKLLAMFNSLQQHYFHFKLFFKDRSKYDCPDKILFRFTTREKYYQVEHPSSDSQPVSDEIRLLKYLKKYRLTQADIKVRDAIDLLIDTIQGKDAARLLENPYNKAMLFAMQQTIKARLEGSPVDPAELITSFMQRYKEATPKPW